MPKTVYFDPAPTKAGSPLFVLVKAERGYKAQTLDAKSFTELARQIDLCDEDGDKLYSFGQALKLAQEKHIQKKLKASR